MLGAADDILTAVPSSAMTVLSPPRRSVDTPQPGPWYRDITPYQWRVLAAAKVGWMLDALDFMLFVMAVGQLRTYFGFGDATAGMLGTATLVMSGFGGLIFGYVADRAGRTRALMATVILFSIASAGAATSQSLVQLLFWRALLGLGMGGEWASGAVLVSETWPAAHRNKAISIMQSGWALGYMAASLIAAAVLGSSLFGANAWRVLFLVGLVPALFAIWIRRHVHEPERRRTTSEQVSVPANPLKVIFGRALIGRTIGVILLGSAVQFANWGVFFWLPTFLARPVEAGGAGMGIVGSLGWLIPVQLGAYAGYLTFGFLADRFGRHRTFIAFMLMAAVIVPVYGQFARERLLLLLLSPLLGYFGYGYFSMFGSFVAELFPASVRATGQGTSYNIGRMSGALAPYVIGRLAAIPGVGIGLALASTSAFFLLGAVIVMFFPDRSGQQLAD
jgi:MFS family permease